MRRKTRRRSHRFRWSLRLSRNPPKAPSSRRRRRRRPAGRGHSGRPGRGGRAKGRVGRPPSAGLLLVPRRKVWSTRRWTQISALSLPVCAAPAPLHSAPRPGQLGERSRRPRPPPPPPSPPPEAPPPRPTEVAGEASEPGEQSSEIATARGVLAGPAPDPTKRLAEGCLESGSGESGGNHHSRVQGKDVERYCVDPCDLSLSPREGDGGTRRHCQLLRSGPMAILDSRPLLPGNVPFRA